MKLPVYCIKDDLLGFQTPFCSMNDGAACRDFENLMTKEGSIYIQHKDMFNLYRIGEFDSESGEIVSKIEFIKSATVFDR